MCQRDKPRLALNNNTAGVRKRSEWSGGPSDIEGKTTRVGASECGQRTSFNRTREAGNRDEIEGIVANTLNLFRNGANLFAKTFGVGFIDWLGGLLDTREERAAREKRCQRRIARCQRNQTQPAQHTAIAER